MYADDTTLNGNLNDFSENSVESDIHTRVNEQGNSCLEGQYL